MNPTITLAGLCLMLAAPLARPQGTAFTYQGRLNDGLNQANGNYDLKFSLFDAAAPGGNQIGASVIAAPTGVTNGLFTVALDFGSNFPGAARWLEIGVRTNGSVAAYATLLPRQQVTPTPYAIQAGAVTGLVVQQNASSPNVVAGAGINYVAPGTVGAVIGGGGTTNYSGAAFSNSISGDFGVIGGGNNNSIQPGAYSTVGGGFQNSILNNSGGSTISGGILNEINPASSYASIDGGNSNTVGASSAYAVIGGGSLNSATGQAAAVVGGENNQAAGDHAFIGGGSHNSAKRFDVVGGGQNNVVGADFSGILSGQANVVGETSGTGLWSYIGGGQSNTISTGADHGVIGGGFANSIGVFTTNPVPEWATITGGFSNAVGGSYALAAGRQAKANYTGDFVWADSTPADFASTGTNQFLIRAVGGVGIGTTFPIADLDVESTVHDTAIRALGVGNGVEGSGSLNGVVGSSGGTGVSGSGATGVLGSGIGASATGVSGSGATGVSGTGIGASATGVSGSGATGVSGSGIGAGGTGVSGSGAIGVQGTSSSGPGVVGSSTSGDGVTGASGSGTGVRGSSSSGIGGTFAGGAAAIYANGNVGVGTTTPAAKLHVYGNSAPGANVPANTAVLASGDGFNNRLMSANGNTVVYMAMSTKSPTNYGEVSTYDYAHSVGLPLVLNGNGGLVGINSYDPDDTLTVNGPADKPGGGSWGTFSDARLKDVGANFSRGLADLDTIQPVHYRYKRDNPLNLPSEPEYIGVIAQQVQKAIPEAVEQNKDGYLKVNNDPIIWTMLNAIKDLKAQNEALKQRLDLLEKDKSTLAN